MNKLKCSSEVIHVCSAPTTYHFAPWLLLLPRNTANYLKHCTVLELRALHCTALNCTKLHCAALH